MSLWTDRTLRFSRTALAGLVALSTLAACAGGAGPAPEAPAPTKANIDAYRLGTGDRFRMVVYDEPNLTGEFSVDGAGNVSLPLIGKVKAGGLTAPELEEAIVNGLSPQYLKDPSVAVEIVAYRPFYIVGEVNEPGSYPYVNGMTVINAVALAGGFTYRAREGNFRIERDAKHGVRSLEGQITTQVLPGDVITVRERYF